MKKSKISSLPVGHNDKVLIDEQEFSDESHIELICNICHCGPLVTIADKTGNSDLFCRKCGVTYNLEDDTVRHKQRLSVPLETEPALSTTPGIPDISIRKEKKLEWGAAQLAKRGTIKFTNYTEGVG